jgi:hypothetical protein
MCRSATLCRICDISCLKCAWSHCIVSLGFWVHWWFEPWRGYVPRKQHRVCYNSIQIFPGSLAYFPYFEKKMKVGLWDYEIILLSVCACPSVCVFSSFLSLWALWDHLAVSLEYPRYILLRGLWDHLAVCVPPNFFLFYVVRLITKESRGLILLRSSCSPIKLYMRFDILTPVTMNVASCSLVAVHLHFGWTYCFLLQDWMLSEGTSKQNGDSVETTWISFIVCSIFTFIALQTFCA